MIEAFVNIKNIDYELTRFLVSLVHVRGYNLCTSYCILELKYTSSEVMFPFMNYSKFKLRYGKDEEYTDWFKMEVLHTTNKFERSDVRVTIVGVEPGFNRLSETTRIKSYPNQKISTVVATLANEAKLKTDKIEATQGDSTFLQTNVTNLQFISRYLLPLSMDSGGRTPYLFTIDNGQLRYAPPKLNNETYIEYSISPNIHTLCKRLIIRNKGGLSDFTSGSSCEVYGYDPLKTGFLNYNNSLAGVSQNMGKKEYESDYSRVKFLPYDKKWMLQAYDKNLLANSKFMVDSYAIVDGDIRHEPDKLVGFAIPLSSGDLAEYSGEYYVYEVVQMIKPRIFLSHLKLISNSVLEGEKTW